MKGRGYKLLLNLCGLILFWVIFLILPNSAGATDHLVINEIYPNPDSSCDISIDDQCRKEWIELYNPSSDIIDLKDFTLSDKTSSKNLSGTIPADGYLVLFEIPSLNNDGDEITLSLALVEIDKAEYGNFTSYKSKSFARYPNGIDSDQEENFRIGFPTRGGENTILIYSDAIQINELVPQPATGSADEFIELYNTGVADVDLSGWQLDDIDDGSSAYTVPDGTIISAGQYLAFYNSVTRISLNDSGDSVRLLDPNGDIKDIVLYDKANRGQSYSKFADGWQWTTTLTPAAINILTIELETIDVDPVIPVVDIATARTKLDGVTVTVTGTVTAPPGVLSTQYFYIEDDTGGIQIYCYSKEFPNLKAGDIVRVTGELASYQNERRLKINLISDITITGSRAPPEPQKTTIDEIKESAEGTYIQVVGTVTKTSGSTFYIHGPKGAPLGGSGEIQVIIRSNTSIKKPRMSVGDKVQISGILSQYKDQYRILPITQDDVKIVGRGEELPESGSGLFIPVIFSIIISVFICYGSSFKQFIRYQITSQKTG